MGAIKSSTDVGSRALKIIQEFLTEPSLADSLQGNPRVGRALGAIMETAETTLEATDRVRSIVQSLKDFANLDQAELQLVDLHLGIDSTLTLIQHLLRDRIEIVRDYASLPHAQCFVSQINQVFMNLLTNAVQAIEDTGSITITTRQEEAWAVVEIADTGHGIEPEQIERLFDPGFTTKGVGVGLGLAIAYRIIEEHDGSLDLASEVGKGTTFTIRLPLASPSG